MEILEFPYFLGFVFISAFSIYLWNYKEYNQSHTLGIVFCINLKYQERELEIKPWFADNPFLAQFRDR